MGIAEAISRSIAPRLSARRLSILFTIIAIALWSYSLTQAKFHIGFLGLLESLPISFFVALVFLTSASAILWVSPENHGKLLFLQLCLLITALWLTPVLIGGSLPFHAYRYWYWGEKIFQYGHILPGVIFYHDWPGSLIVYASGCNIVGIDLPPDGLVRIYPFLFQFLLLLPLYLFLRNTLGEDRSNYCWAAAWLFYLANWVGQGLMSAQALGFLLVFFALALFTSPDWEQGAKASHYRLIIIIFLAAITITHLIAVSATLFIIAALFAARRIKGFVLPMLAVVFIASWMMYVATVFFEAKLPGMIQDILRLDILFTSGVTERITGSASHEAVVKIRLLTSSMFMAIAFAGYLLSRKTKRTITADKTVLAIGMGSLLLLVMIGASIGTEAFMRWWLFFLAPMAYFGVKLLNFKTSTIILFILLLIAVPLHMVSHHGNQAMSYTPPAYIAGSQFIYENTTPSYYEGAGPGYRVGTIYSRFAGDQGGFGFYFDKLEWKDSELINPDAPEEGPYYIFIGQWDKAYCGFMLNEPYFIDEIQDSLNNATNCNLIYSNPGQGLYICEK